MSDKQQAIKQAAITLFSERGYDGTTVPIIAKEANVGAGTIYRYFENKETLLNVIMQEEITVLEQNVRSSFPHEASFREQFGHVFVQLVGFSQSHFESLMLIASHITSRHLNEQTRAVYDDFLDYISEVIVRGKKLEMIRANLPSEAIILIVFGAIVEVAKWNHNKCTVLTDELKKSLEESLWRAIGVE